MNKIIRNTLQYLLFLFLGIFLVWLSFRKVSADELMQGIREANYFWILVGSICAILAHIVRAMRWNLLISQMNYKTRTSTTFHALMVGYMANTGVPRLGEFMRCGVLARREKISFNALFGTVISERLFDLVFLTLFLVLVVVGQWKLAGSFVHDMLTPFMQKLQAKGDIISIILAVLGILLAFALWIGWKNRRKIKSLPGYSKVHDIIVSITLGVRTIERMPRKGLFLVYTALIWFFYALMMYFPLFMLTETASLGFMSAITLLAIGTLGVVAPVPGGIGAYHFIGIAVLTQLYGISQSTAASFVTITHAAQTVLNVGVGAIGYVMLVFFNRKPPLNEPS
ncbi:MAG TPA: lysylphosphatidylglycerol synthase transmembrane domain-containing protein [Bacteroidales bacterium]|nr:lysylphosphatidylglycerol synthase transmembrane domain-containing protein [Bacteroidales bacterium]